MPTRRQFLIGSAAIAGGVAIGFRLNLPDRLRDSIDLEPTPTALTPYVLIDKDGITIITPRAEMGQGIHTTLAALVAEELDVGFEQIRVEHGPASDQYSNTIFFGTPPYADGLQDVPKQATGGQTSIRDAFVKMRKAGAAARIVLMRAAALRLGVDLDTLATRDGAVVDAGGNEILYVDLATAAAEIELPEDPPLKPRKKWTLLGKSLPRVDMYGKCTGTAEYAIDVALPGLLYATVKRNPRLGGKMLGFDASKASNMRGVRRIIPMDAGVIVVATNTWYAFQAADRIEFDWGPASYPETTAGHRECVEGEFDKEPYYRPRDRGDVEAALNNTQILEGSYRAPYLAHATMEPLNATALLKDGRLDIWAGNQFPTLAVRVGARLTGLRQEAVRVHTTYMGGGFGRRFEMDDVEAAVRAARAIPGTPVRVTYSREEDFSHDAYRPMAAARFRASVADGKPLALDLDVSAPSLFVSGNSRRQELTGEPEKGVPKADVSIAMGAGDQPYKIENYRVTAYRPENLLPVGWWRSVGESQNCFFHECIMDELAHGAGADPLMMRLSVLKHAPSRQVLESVAEMSNWGSDLPEGHARGVAYALSYGVPTAAVIEITHSAGGIKLHKAFAAVDVGIALDRRNIEAQVQGALNFGLSSAIFGEITVTDGAVDQTNFDAYPLLQLHQAPSVEVRLHERGRRIKGIGEAATPTAAPALGNAIFAATGKRIRELPFRKFFRFA
jgi:isoquinoline 1-oxidoreductase beta subunit